MTNYDDDRDILNYKTGGMTLEEMSSITFLQWVANKLNDIPLYKGTAQELIQLVQSPPLGSMPPSQKLEIFRKMLALDIPL